MPPIQKGGTVAVTGAAGFIGSHLTERLVDVGASVKAFMHYNSMGTWGGLMNLRLEMISK